METTQLSKQFADVNCTGCKSYKNTIYTICLQDCKEKIQTKNCLPIYLAVNTEVHKILITLILSNINLWSIL